MNRIASAEQRLLQLLATEGPHTTRELRDRLDVSNSAAHKYLTNLRAEGLVEGAKCPTTGGRPAFRFSITTRGRDLLEQEIGTRLAALTEEREALANMHRVVMAAAATD